MIYLSPVSNVGQCGSDKTGQNGLKSGLETPERGPVVFVEDGQGLEEEGLEPAIGLAVQDDWPDDDELVVNLIRKKEYLLG